jgi:hypothetical protein
MEFLDVNRKYTVEIVNIPKSAPEKFGLPNVNVIELYGLSQLIGSKSKYCKYP